MPKKKPLNRDTILFPRQRMVEADAADKRLFDDMEQTSQSHLLVLNERAKKKYDGVVGTLPDWMPPDFHLQFEDARNQLLRQLSYTEVFSYLKEYGKYFKPKYDGRPRFPIAYTKLIGALHYIQKAVSLGEEKGLAWLVGPTAARKLDMGNRYSKHQSSNAQKSRVKVGDDGDTIKDIIGKLALSRVHEDKSAKELWSHFYSALDERDMDPKEENNQITYDFKNNRRPITFRRFANVCADYRKKKSR